MSSPISIAVIAASLHKEVPQLNAMGIEVRYLAYPRAGIGSESYQKMVTAWCAKDRQATLTRFKNGEAVPISTCADNPVTAEFQLGERLGVSGTPTMITAAGELIPGYVPAAELASTPRREVAGYLRAKGGCGRLFLLFCPCAA